MELTELKYFYNVAITRSFGEGARLSHVTPPAISKSVKRLEAELGAELFVRTTRRVALTDRGEILLSHCRQLFEQIDALHRDLDDAEDTVRGELRIAANEVFSSYLLPHALARVVRAHPAVSPRCYEMIPEQIEHGIREGDLDVGFTIGAAEMSGVDTHLVARSKGVVVCGREHPLYESGRISPEDLDRYPSVVPRFFRREYLPSMDQFPDDRYPRRIGATIELLQMGVQLAIDGAYLGYFPEVTVRCYLGRGELRALEGLEDGKPFELQVVTRQGTTPRAAAQLVIDTLRRSIEESAQTCA